MATARTNRMFTKAIKSIGFVDSGANVDADILTVKRLDVTAPGTEDVVLKADVAVESVDLDKRRVISWCYVARKADGSLSMDSGGTTTVNGVVVPNASDRDVVDTPESLKSMEDAFYAFLSSGEATADDMHSEWKVARVVGGIVFSPETQKALKIPPGVVPLAIASVIDVPKNPRGDQLLADIASGKRKQMSIVAAIERVPIDDTDIRKLAADAAHAQLGATHPSLAAKLGDAAALFSDIANSADLRDDVQEAVCQLEQSLYSIFNDESLRPEQTSSMVQQSAVQFAAAITAIAAGTDDTAAKAGAKMASARLTKFKSALDALTSILTELEGTMSEKKTPTLDASKLDPAVKAHIEAQDVAIATLKAELAAKAEPEDVFKGISAEVRKRIEDTERRAKDAEAKADAETARRLESEWVTKARSDFPKLAAKPEEFGLVLKRAESSLPAEDFAEIQRVLKAMGAQIAENDVLTNAIGGSGEVGDTTQKINALAQELVSKGAVKTIEQARVQVRQNNPDLARTERAEQQATRH